MPAPPPVDGRSQSVAAALIFTGQRQECIHRSKLTAEFDNLEDLKGFKDFEFSRQVPPLVYSIFIT